MSKHENNRLKSVAEQDYTVVGEQAASDTKHAELFANLEDLTQQLEKGLARMGLTLNEARVYIFLAKKGAKKASEVAKLLDFPRTAMYQILSSLQKKGLVSSKMHAPAKFVAVPFDAALNTLLGIEKQRLVSLGNQGKALLDIWSSISNYEVVHEEIDEEKFQILEGNNVVYRRISDIVSSAKKEVIIMMTDKKHLTRLYHSEVTDQFQSLTAKGVHVKILASFDTRLEEILGEMKGCEIKMLTEYAAKLHYIVVDKTQLLFFIKDDSDKKAPSAIWTDSRSLVQSILCLFEELWKQC